MQLQFDKSRALAGLTNRENMEGAATVAQRLAGPDKDVRLEALHALGELEPAALKEHAAIVQRLEDADVL